KPSQNAPNILSDLHLYARSTSSAHIASPKVSKIISIISRSSSSISDQYPSASIPSSPYTLGSTHLSFRLFPMASVVMLKTAPVAFVASFRNGELSGRSTSEGEGGSEASELLAQGESVGTSDFTGVGITRVFVSMRARVDV